MQAVILAGGKGTRLRPYSVSLPKPLVPVGNYPILEIVIRQLKRYGFDEITISTGHMAELLEAYFGSGTKWGVNIEYVREARPLNTAGPLKLLENLDENVLVMNGDILTDMDFAALYEYHCRQQGIATLGVYRREVQIDLGVLEVDGEDRLVNYVEKPVHSFWVSMGVNVVNRRIRDYIGDGESIGLPELMMRLKAAGEDLICYRAACHWLDIGRPEDYERAQEIFEISPKEYLPDGS